MSALYGYLRVPGMYVPSVGVRGPGTPDVDAAPWSLCPGSRVADPVSAGGAATFLLDGACRALENCHIARSKVRIRTPASFASDLHACVYAHQKANEYAAGGLSTPRLHSAR